MLFPLRVDFRDFTIRVTCAGERDPWQRVVRMSSSGELQEEGARVRRKSTKKENIFEKPAKKKERNHDDLIWYLPFTQRKEGSLNHRFTGKFLVLNGNPKKFQNLAQNLLALTQGLIAPCTGTATRAMWSFDLSQG